MQFTVGAKLKGKTDHIAVDAADALIAALKVKTEYREAVITYVRQQNRRGDARHPSHALVEDTHSSTDGALCAELKLHHDPLIDYRAVAGSA